MGEVNTLVPVASLELPPSLFFPPLSFSLTSGARLSAAVHRREPTVGRAVFLDHAECAGARVAGRSGFPGRPSSSWLGFSSCFVLFFFTDFGTYSKICISLLVDPNDVVPILLSS